MEMELSTQEMDGGITRVELDGRMDIAGAAAVDMKMNLIAGSAKKAADRLAKGHLPRFHGIEIHCDSRARGAQARAAKSSSSRQQKWWNRF